MPLSEHEQRLFDQIEQSLAEDPKFASAVRSTDPRFQARRRIIVAAVAVLTGLGILVFAVAGKSPLLGVAGFVVMLAGAALGIQGVRRARSPEPGPATVPRRRGGGSLLGRLEDRWRRRPESDR